MDKIFEMLGIDKLDEEKQEKLKTELETIIESKAAEKSVDVVKEEKEKLVVEFEEKFETYKDDVTSKFSNFLDDILDEEMVIPEQLVEYARIGEEYHSLIESFKTKLAIDEGVLDKETKNLLKESRDEIIKLQEEKDELISTNLEYKNENEKLANDNYLQKKCEGLLESQRKKIMIVLEGASIEDIDKKFDTLVKLHEEDDDKEPEMMECPECGEDIEKGSKKCPECGAELVKEEGKDKKKKKESKSQVDDKDDDDKKIDENSPKAAWLKIINENRY